MQTVNLQPFASWADVLAYVVDGDRAPNTAPIYYHAPLDVRAVRVCVTHVYKNGKLRIMAPSPDCDSFTADAGHLDRFRRPA